MEWNLSTFGWSAAGWRKLNKPGPSWVMLLAASLLLSAQAEATEAGWRQITVAGNADSAPIPVALYFPTQAPARAVAMGPFNVRVAFGAVPAEPLFTVGTSDRFRSGSVPLPAT